MRYGLAPLLIVVAIGPPAIYCVVRGARFGGLDLGTAWLFWLALCVWFAVWRGAEWWQFGRQRLDPILNAHLVRSCESNPYESPVAEWQEWHLARIAHKDFAADFIASEYGIKTCDHIQECRVFSGLCAHKPRDVK